METNNTQKATNMTNFQKRSDHAKNDFSACLNHCGGNSVGAGGVKENGEVSFMQLLDNDKRYFQSCRRKANKRTIIASL